MNNLERSRFDAYLGQHQTFWVYLSNYKSAFEILLNDVNSSNRNIDYISYPILFLARHGMELGFKTNIRYFMKYSEKNDFSKADTHNLSDLFQGFQLHVNTTIKKLRQKHNILVEKSDIEEFKKYCKDVEKLTIIFHKLDRNSDSFRYPVDKENNSSFSEKEKLNILDLQELLNNSMILFMYTADVFSKYTNFADEIEDMYEQEMARLYNY